jgi:hypothetical protein
MCAIRPSAAASSNSETLTIAVGPDPNAPIQFGTSRLMLRLWSPDPDSVIVGPGDEPCDDGLGNVAGDVAKSRRADEDLNDPDHDGEQEHRLIGVKLRVRIAISAKRRRAGDSASMSRSGVESQG